MTNTYTAKQLFPRTAFVGFDRIFDELDRVARHATDSYPPHNILKTSDTNYQIELAVAGFAQDELNITVEDRTLTVEGAHKDRGREYIHKGISTKKFQRKFRLSEYVEVAGADVKDGVLAIHLEVIIPDAQRPRQIKIGSSQTTEPQLLVEENDDTRNLLQP